MANKIKFKIINNNFSDLIDKLDELTKIDDTIKMKIDNDNILIYSMMRSGQTILAFKNYLLNTRDYLEYDEIDQIYDIIIVNSKKLVKNLNFIKLSDKINFEISYKESQDDDNIMCARTILFTGGKLKVNWLSGEHYEMRDMTKDILNKKLDTKYRKWFFTISQSDFSDIKKLSNINSERVITINVNDGKVTLSEKSSWELEIDSIDKRTTSLILNKKFLNSINNEDENVEFGIFDNFMLVKNHNSNLMLSFEQNFDQD